MNKSKYWRTLFLSICSALLVATGFSWVILTAATTTAKPQAQEEKNSNIFKDPDGKYELELPAKWQAVNYKDGAGNPRVDIIYRDRSFGLLKITQETADNSDNLENFIRGEIDQNLRFRPGYVYNGMERFVGQHTRGQLLQFDFTNGGTPKKARNYYLKNNTVNVWVLRFVGNRDILAPLRNETDAIARSFKPLK